MNRREIMWSISHDIIQMFGSDFGVFKNMAEKVMYEKIQEKTDVEIDNAYNAIVMRIRTLDDKDAKKKR